MASYVKYKTPEEVVASIIEALSVAKDTGRLRKGINETTKSVEKKTAKLVIMAEDVQPEEIIIHILRSAKRGEFLTHTSHPRRIWARRWESRWEHPLLQLKRQAAQMSSCRAS